MRCAKARNEGVAHGGLERRTLRRGGMCGCLAAAARRMGKTQNRQYNELNKAMRKAMYSAPEAEVIMVRMEENFLIYNQEFNEDDDDIFGDENN